MTTAKEALVETNMSRMYIVDTTTCVPRPRLGLVMFSRTTDMRMEQ
jgi:hypothetical protein